METKHHCALCKNEISCTSSLSCWCNKLPKILPPVQNASCLCPSCLIEQTAKAVNTEEQQISLTQAHEIAKLGPPTNPKEAIDFYMENGLLVMTKWYLLRRGYCCDNGCRHCPHSKADK